MQLIADILLGGGALAAGYFCYVLSRRLKTFTQLENGVGGAIAVLSVQVDDMTRALHGAQKTAGESASSLEEKTRRAEEAARKLELMLAVLHDLPAEESETRPRFVRRRGRPLGEAAE